MEGLRDDMAMTPAKFRTGWLTRTGCTSLAEKAKSRLESHARLLARHSVEIDKAKQSAAGSLRHISRDRRDQAIRDTVRGARAEQARLSKDQRLAHVREITELAQTASEALPFYVNPVAVLNRRTLADPKRQAYVANLADAGPAELAQLAQYAAATSDHALAYACIARCERMPARDRPFSRQELADHMVGDECFAAQVALREVELAAMQALYDDTAFETGESSGQRSLEIAAKRRELDRYIGDREPVDEDEPEVEDDLNPDERRIADQIKVSLAGGDA
jgi:hypothetical protein